VARGMEASAFDAQVEPSASPSLPAPFLSLPPCLLLPLSPSLSLCFSASAAVSLLLPPSLPFSLSSSHCPPLFLFLSLRREAWMCQRSTPRFGEGHLREALLREALWCRGLKDDACCMVYGASDV
jgi:hypothetical protein